MNKKTIKTVIEIAAVFFAVGFGLRFLLTFSWWSLAGVAVAFAVMLIAALVKDDDDNNNNANKQYYGGGSDKPRKPAQDVAGYAAEEW